MREGLIGRILGIVSGRACDAAGLLVLVMAVLINVEIIYRYVFRASTLIADEYSGYLFVWISLLGFGYALRSGQFLRVDVVVMRLPPRARAASDILSALVGLMVSAVITYASAKTVLTSWRFGTLSIQPSMTPLWIPQLILPVGMAWLCLLYVERLVRSWRALKGRSRSGGS